MNLKLKCTPGIYVVGFMASGKSTIGRLLAQRLGWTFVDIDDEIEAAERTAIAEIFDTRGEAEFRRIETAIIHRHVHRIGQGIPAVLALGGGAFAAEANRALLENNGVTVWLDCPFEVVERRVDVVEFFWIRQACGADPARTASSLMRQFAKIQAESPGSQ